jgi:hypothetical protein
MDETIEVDLSLAGQEVSLQLKVASVIIPGVVLLTFQIWQEESSLLRLELHENWNGMRCSC